MDQDELVELLQEKVRVTGDGNVVGKDNTVTINELSAGDYAIQIGQVNVSLSLDELRRLLAVPNTSSPPRPGSAPPFPTLVVGREEALQDLKSRLGVRAGARRRTFLPRTERNAGPLRHPRSEP